MIDGSRQSNSSSGGSEPSSGNFKRQGQGKPLRFLSKVSEDEDELIPLNKSKEIYNAKERKVIKID